ncbi:tRNA (adenosine(37)-N6)-threonylcarbamoyltransferase complex dimerization subunit type 1 TsaB [Companilactobacillus keshanensis]|uniref:tRNA (Adenosine(37)-N6)-threonylcarbamoyltransferase complex dimerization subunit type 1 TsaB n=1 Tax=Companilactobacillus keshanensis TaxID=2486003 RepID=A0ABW4BY92_9LACO|nr:tRNA (adenosine(37)-N6)-threonylcarbamoyltransferase complex dimerization subunit type 1 TsaB [Companilactobacillus keshanensis]
MKILAFDTSNKPLTVAVVSDGNILASIESTEKKTHSVSLLPDIQQVLKDSKLSIEGIDLIAVAQGPGSYTGVRIAVTVAKTLAFTLKKNLVGVSSLEVLAADGSEDKILVPLMDARNDNAFAGVYQYQDGKLVNLIEDHHTSMEKLLGSLKQHGSDKLEFINATEHLTDLIKDVYPGAMIMDTKDSLPKADKLAKLAENKPVVSDVDNFVPNYLRLTQAEHDWYQKGHKKDGNISYVEEV